MTLAACMICLLLPSATRSMKTGASSEFEQLADVQRIAFVRGVAAEGRGRALLAERRGGRHLPAGHAVDAVVDEDHGDGLAAIGGVDDLGGADGGQVAIALVADHDAVRAAALDRGGDGRGAPVRHLDVADVEVVVGEDRAADRADQHRAVLHAELVDGLGQQLVDDAVAAAGAVVRLVLQFAPCARSCRRTSGLFRG